MIGVGRYDTCRSTRHASTGLASSPTRRATWCFWPVTNPHVARIRLPATTGEAMERSLVFVLKTDFSHATFPVLGSTAVTPCCQLVKRSSGGRFPSAKTHGVAYVAFLGLRGTVQRTF